MTCIICGAPTPPNFRAPHVDEDGYPARCNIEYIEKEARPVYLRELNEI